MAFDTERDEAGATASAMAEEWARTGEVPPSRYVQGAGGWLRPVCLRCRHIGLFAGALADVPASAPCLCAP